MGYVFTGSIKCECQRYYVEDKKGKKNKKGNPISFPTEVRKMHIRGDFISTDYRMVSLIRRRGQMLYSVKSRKKPNRAWWDKSPIRDEEYKWQREGMMTREEFLKFLQVNRIPNPEAWTVELETCPPDNIAA